MDSKYKQRKVQPKIQALLSLAVDKDHRTNSATFPHHTTM
jgi:hypothetical protein